MEAMVSDILQTLLYLIWSLVVYRIVHPPVITMIAGERGSTPRQRDYYFALFAA